MRARRAGAGFVLVAVLGGLLLVGAVTFALLFVSSLDALASRSAQRAVVEREALEAALHLAAAELAAAPEPLAATALGPWPALGVTARVAVTLVGAPGEEQALRLEARLPQPARRAPAVLVVSPPPALEPLWRP